MTDQSLGGFSFAQANEPQMAEENAPVGRGPAESGDAEGPGNEVIYGNFTDETLNGDGGNDLIYGADGDDIIYGGADNDTIFGERGADVVYGGNGDDRIEGDLVNFGFADIVYGGAGNDTVTPGFGQPNEDSYFGGTGVDTIEPGGLSYFASAKWDLNAGTFEVPEFGFTESWIGFENYINPSASGSEQVTGNDAANTIETGGGNNILFGLGGNDTIIAGGGDDTVEGGAGADSLDGGAGLRDTLSYEDSTGSVVINLGTGQAVGGSATGDTISNFEAVKGSSEADLLTGNDGDNTLDGGEGNDILRGGLGSDTLIGSGGFDFADYRDAPGPLTIDLATPSNSSSFFSDDTLIDIRGIFGASSFQNTFIGDGGRTFFTGGAQGDIIRGEGGSDILRGFGGDDTIEGGDGNDAMLGNAGNDTLTGGADRDVFWFGSGTDGNDVITDFTIGADLIAFQGGAITGFGQLSFDTSADGWAIVSWGTAGDTVELQNVTEVQANNAALFLFF